MITIIIYNFAIVIYICINSANTNNINDIFFGFSFNNIDLLHSMFADCCASVPGVGPHGHCRTTAAATII